MLEEDKLWKSLPISISIISNIKIAQPRNVMIEVRCMAEICQPFKFIANIQPENLRIQCISHYFKKLIITSSWIIRSTKTQITSIMQTIPIIINLTQFILIIVKSIRKNQLQKLDWFMTDQLTIIKAIEIDAKKILKSCWMNNLLVSCCHLFEMNIVWM